MGEQGVISNTWVWGGDHNLTDNSDMTPHLHKDSNWEGALSGIRIDSDGQVRCQCTCAFCALCAALLC